MLLFNLIQQTYVLPIGFLGIFTGDVCQSMWLCTKALKGHGDFHKWKPKSKSYFHIGNSFSWMSISFSRIVYYYLNFRNLFSWIEIRSLNLHKSLDCIALEKIDKSHFYPIEKIASYKDTNSNPRKRFV